MFERYTEHARRVIFFARYEASQFGSRCIETEHFLLGILREDRTLASRFLSDADIKSVRKEVEAHVIVREKVSTSADLPMSQACKRILAYACEESERLGHKHIGTEHLLAGILREEKGFAAGLLHERGLLLSSVREELWRPMEKPPATQKRPAIQFERFTESALRATCYAIHEASNSGSAIIEIEHLLLGTLREDKPETVRFLGSAGQAIRLKIAAQGPPNAESPDDADLGLSREYLEALAFACGEATRMGRENVETGHLLLGILNEKDTLAAEVLREEGVSAERVRADFER